MLCTPCFIFYCRGQPENRKMNTVEISENKLFELKESADVIESRFYAGDKVLGALYYIYQELYNSFKMLWGNDKLHHNIKQQFDVFLLCLEALMQYHDTGKEEMTKYTDLLLDLTVDDEEFIF